MYSPESAQGHFLRNASAISRKMDYRLRARPAGERDRHEAGTLEERAARFVCFGHRGQKARVRRRVKKVSTILFRNCQSKWPE